MKIDINPRERAIAYVNGRPEQYLTPGRHSLWAFRRKVEVVRSLGLTAELDAEALALVPASDLTAIEVASHQRALVTKRNKPAAWLLPGTHFVWTFDRI